MEVCVRPFPFWLPVHSDTLPVLGSPHATPPRRCLEFLDPVPLGHPSRTVQRFRTRPVPSTESFEGSSRSRCPTFSYGVGTADEVRGGPSR